MNERARRGRAAVRYRRRGWCEQAIRERIRPDLEDRAALGFLMFAATRIHMLHIMRRVLPPGMTLADIPRPPYGDVVAHERG